MLIFYGSMKRKGIHSLQCRGLSSLEGQSMAGGNIRGYNVYVG